MTRQIEKDEKINWKPWNGGSNPIGKEEEFAVKFRGQKEFEQIYGDIPLIDDYEVSTLLRWEHIGDHGDILEYGIVEKVNG